MPKFNHAFTVGFSIVNDSAEGEVTAAEIRAALQRVLAEYSDSDLLENAGAPFDTYEI